MARIEKTIEIDRPVEDVWKVVGDFGGISTWLPALAASSYADGVRECSLEGGGVLREEITTRDDEGHTYEYVITEAPIPIESHWASMSVEPCGSGAKVRWITEIAPDDVGAAMEPVFDEGVRSLKNHLEAG